jgi:site-specific recombinase XerD
MINKTLKQLAADAGITKKLSTHISRHSFAKAAKMKGIDNLSVKELLAQSSVAVTERYMGEFDTDQNDAALRKVFDDQSDLDRVRELLRALPDSVVESLLVERLGERKIES